MIVGYFVWDGVARAIHQVRGREITQIGTELLGVLDAYGPSEQSEGHRSESRLSDLWDDSNDPTRRWTYSGHASFDPETGSDNAAEAYDAIRTELTARGWEGGRASRLPTGGYVYFKGGWTLTLHYNPGSDDTATRNKIGLYITSPMAGGPRLG